MKLTKILIVLILLNLNPTYVISIEPDVFVQSTVNRASDILSRNISREDKISELKKIAKDTVDIRGVGFYSLGTVRNTINEQQKKQYFDLFENYF